MNLDNKLNKNALSLTTKLNSLGFKTYFVGGCVRDLLSNESPHDWDICTTATPDEIKKIFSSQILSTIGEKYGTIVVKIEDDAFEITTLRIDGDEYINNRKPDKVYFTESIDIDLSRRDFTINAMAIDTSNFKLIDPFNGEKDLKSKIIRCVGEANKRFSEDALRIIRAMRFAITKQMQIEKLTSEAMLLQANLLNTISKERITTELQKMLCCEYPISNVFTKYQKIIGVIIPEMVPCFNFDQHSPYHIHDVYQHIIHTVDNAETDDVCTKMALLLHDIGKPSVYTIDEAGCGHFYKHGKASYDIAKEVLYNDFRFEKKQIEDILTLVVHHDIHLVPTDAFIKRCIKQWGEDNFLRLLRIRQADLDDHVWGHFIQEQSDMVILLQERYCQLKDINNEKFTLKQLAINGNDIQNILHEKPGKKIGIILNILYEDVINDVLPNEKTVLEKRTVEINYTLLKEND